MTDALEQVGGLQSQYAPSAYIGLWSRLENFERPSLTRALEERRAVQATLMRSTIHTVSAFDFHPLAAAIRSGRREWWLRAARHQIGEVDMESVAKLLRRALKDGPRRASELRALLADNHLPAIAWSGAGAWVDMVRVPPSGTWEQRRADLYGLADDWLGPGGSREPSGLSLLVMRYLHGFGPASVNDVAGWAGLPVTKVAEAVAHLVLPEFRDANGGRLVDVPSAPLPDPDEPAPVRFLPTWDATLLVHARRTQILPERYRPLVFNTRTPHSVPTFLVDGQVAGSWRHEKGRVILNPFGRLTRAAGRALEAEAYALAEFHKPG